MLQGFEKVAELRSVKEVEKFLRKEEPRYHADEDVELEEFDELEAEFELDEVEDGDYSGDDEGDAGAVSLPSWSRVFEDGPPKLEEDVMIEVDRQARETELTRLEKMGVLKQIEIVCGKGEDA